MRAIVLGKEVLGATDPPLNRRSGVDRVDATLGDYRDASAKGNLVHLLATESNGALSPAVWSSSSMRSPSSRTTLRATTPHRITVLAVPRPDPSSRTAPVCRHFLSHHPRRRSCDT